MTPEKIKKYYQSFKISSICEIKFKSFNIYKYLNECLFCLFAWLLKLEYMDRWGLFLIKQIKQQTNVSNLNLYRCNKSPSSLNKMKTSSEHKTPSLHSPT